MQNTKKNHTNPSFKVGLWAAHALRPELGAGQVQLVSPDGRLCVIEHWQSDHPSELIYPATDLRLAKYLYMGHSNNVLCYVHGLQVRKVAFRPTPQIFTADDFDELQTDYTTRKAYLQAAHAHSLPIDADDIEYIIGRWWNARAVKDLIPYIMGQYGGQFQTNTHEVVEA